MDEEIEEKLKEIYLFEIKVEFVDFRQYKILINIEGFELELTILYDVYSTLENNINSIVSKIDKSIPSLFKKGV